MSRYEGTFDKGNVQVIKTQRNQLMNHDQIMRRDAAISNELRSHGIGMWDELEREERLMWLNSGGSPKEIADAFLIVQRSEGHLEEFVERRVETLERQKAEMLEALEGLVELILRYSQIPVDSLAHAKAAIANAKGKTP